MADLSDIQAAETVKIVGSDSSGLEQTPIQSTSNGALYVAPSDNQRATYSAAINSFAAANLATDIFTITGSATKTVKIIRIGLTASATTDTRVNLIILKRSTANSAGTSTTLTNTAHDSNNAAATAVVRAYTANPTTGTLVGNLKVAKTYEAGTSTVATQQYLWIFGDRPSQPIVLRGTGEVLAINQAGVTVLGTSYDIDIEWTEE